LLLFLSGRRRHARFSRDWSSDVCSSDLTDGLAMSSRNRRLSETERQKAPILYQTLQQIATDLPKGNSEAILKHHTQALIKQGFKIGRASCRERMQTCETSEA